MEKKYRFICKKNPSGYGHQYEYGKIYNGNEIYNGSIYIVEKYATNPELRLDWEEVIDLNETQLDSIINIFKSKEYCIEVLPEDYLKVFKILEALDLNILQGQCDDKMISKYVQVYSRMHVYYIAEDYKSFGFQSTANSKLKQIKFKDMIKDLK